MAFLLMLSLLQSWETGAEMPTPRYAFACAAVGNRVFAIGGLAEQMHQPRSEVEVYDAEADSWITGFAPLPRPRAYAACAVLDGKVYVIGGTDTRMETNRVDRFDPHTNTWDTVASLPWPVQAMGAAVLGDHIYAAGGYSSFNEGRYLKNALRYVPDSGPGSWQEVDSLHEPRAGFGLAAVGDRMYAVGGKYFNHLRSAEYYVDSRWHNAQPCSIPRSDFPAVGYADHICAISGQGPSMRTGSVELLSTLTGRWMEVEPLPTGRMGHGAVVVRDTIYVIGGRDMEGPVGVVLSHRVFEVGIEEQVEESRPGRSMTATVATGRVRITGTGEWDVFDNAGTRVAGGTGATEVKLTPGIYFVRTALAGSGAVTSKVTIPR